MLDDRKLLVAKGSSTVVGISSSSEVLKSKMNLLSGGRRGDHLNIPSGKSDIFVRVTETLIERIWETPTIPIDITSDNILKVTESIARKESPNLPKL